MITEFELTALINEQVPDLEYPLIPVHIGLEAYVTLISFTAYTRRAVHEHHRDISHKCFGLAENLYKEGDRQVKLLIENIFIFDFDNMFGAQKLENNLIKEMIPPSLYKIYLGQVMASGC